MQAWVIAVQRGPKDWPRDLLLAQKGMPKYIGQTVDPKWINPQRVIG